MSGRLRPFAASVLALLLAGALAVVVCATQPFVRAVIHNDESALFYFPSRTLAGLGGERVEDIAIEVEPGVVTHGYLFKPEGTATPKVTVFLLHGSSGNATQFVAYYRPFLARGWQVFAYDWRGYGRSDGAPLHVNVLADTRIAFDQLLRRPDAARTQLLVWGISIGGQVAAALARSHQDQIAALVLDGAAASFHTLQLDNVPIAFLRARLEGHEEKTHQPYKALDDVRVLDRIPKLVIQSQDDRSVPPQRGQALFDAMPPPREIWRTRGGHILTLTLYPNEALERAAALLALR